MTYRCAILGAGAIGCFVGALWSRGIVKAGGSLTLIGRDATLRPLRTTPITINGGSAGTNDLGQMHFSADPADLADADIIVLTMKAYGLAAAMDEIAKNAPRDAAIISLLNGTAPVRQLRERFPDRTIIAGMVPYNVVWKSEARLHRSGAGQIALERHDVTEWLVKCGAELALRADLGPIQHGKLLLNLANAVNALSGKPLYDMLSDRGYRRVYAASIQEALNAYGAASITWEQVGPNNPKLALRMLRAPNWLFDILVLRRQKLDRSSMTSMASDLMGGRPTEIDTINGEIERIGKLYGVETPVNTRLIALVKEVEAGTRQANLSAQDLQGEVGL